MEKSYERILRSRSDGRTDESEFIGPKSASRGTKKRNNYTPVSLIFNHILGTLFSANISFENMYLEELIIAREKTQQELI